MPCPESRRGRSFESASACKHVVSTSRLFWSGRNPSCLLHHRRRVRQRAEPGRRSLRAEPAARADRPHPQPLLLRWGRAVGAWRAGVHRGDAAGEATTALCRPKAGKASFGSGSFVDTWFRPTKRRLLLLEKASLSQRCCGAQAVRIDTSQGTPLQYKSGNWDFGWFYCRTDGHVSFRRCDPYTLTFSDHDLAAGMRWFIR